MAFRRRVNGPCWCRASITNRRSIRHHGKKVGLFLAGLAVALLCLSWRPNVLFDESDYSMGRRVDEVEWSLADATWTRPEKNHTPPLKLRFDWTRLERLSPLALRIAAHQGNCHYANSTDTKTTTTTTTTTMATFRYRNRFGLGSDLHVYSQALCNVLEHNASAALTLRVRTALPWIWYDTQACSAVVGTSTNRKTTASAMTCYFPESELTCPNDWHLSAYEQNQLINLTRGRGRISNDCPTIVAQYGGSGDGNKGMQEVQAATTEFLFTRVSSLVQDEAQRQLNLVFRSKDNNINMKRQDQQRLVPVATVPKNLITVHIRWGDKADEMTLIPIQKYVDAVQQLINERQEARNPEFWNGTDVHIFCATEDPRALDAFTRAAPTFWNIYVDQYFREMLPHRRGNVYNGNPLVALALDGRPGLLALGSLLVAMEANSFVLTTSSNWSRLMDELRRKVLDPRCHNCTRMVNLG